MRQLDEIDHCLAECMMNTLFSVIAQECRRYKTDLDVATGYTVGAINTDSIELTLTRREMLPAQVCAAVKRRTGARDYDSGVGKVTFYYR